MLAGPGRRPGLGQQHQCQDSDGLGLVGEQGNEGASDADRLAGQGRAEQIVSGGGCVALGVDEVDGGEDRSFSTPSVSPGSIAVLP